MASQKNKPDVSQAVKKPGTKNNKAIIAVAAVVVILIVAYFALANTEGSAISTPATANLTGSGSIFSINSQQYLISFAGTLGGSSKAYVHISKLPIFANPLLNVTLTLGNITKVNDGTTYANMGIELDAIGRNSITVKVSPLFTSLEVMPDSQYISIVQGTLYIQGQAATTTIQGFGAGSSTVSTTTISSQSSSSSTSTTVKATNTTALEINSTLMKNYTYSLLLNFSRLYANTSNCTPTLYNSTYLDADGAVPSGPNTYENVSTIVPYGMPIATSMTGSGNYYVNFTTKATDPFYNNRVAVTLEVDPKSGQMVEQIINSTGIFSGQSIVQIGQDYLRALSYGACGVEV